MVLAKIRINTSEYKKGIEMQVRKLIRMLNEIVEKNPKAAYMEACVDTRFGAHWVDEHTYIPIADIEKKNTIWNAENTVNENQRDVIVLGNY